MSGRNQEIYIPLACCRVLFLGTGIKVPDPDSCSAFKIGVVSAMGVCCGCSLSNRFKSWELLYDSNGISRMRFLGGIIFSIHSWSFCCRYLLQSLYLHFKMTISPNYARFCSKRLYARSYVFFSGRSSLKYFGYLWFFGLGSKRHSLKSWPGGDWHFAILESPRLPWKVCSQFRN